MLRRLLRELLPDAAATGLPVCVARGMSTTTASMSAAAAMCLRRARRACARSRRARRGCMSCAGTRPSVMRNRCVAADLAAAGANNTCGAYCAAGANCPAAARYRCSTAAARKTAAIGHGAAAAAIAAATAVGEAMTAPAVAIAPASPWAHAQEDAVVEVPRPIEAHGRAGVGRIVVVAVPTDRLNANTDDDLRASRWRQGQAREQCGGSE
jgi:hypothetical protein